MIRRLPEDGVRIRRADRPGVVPPWVALLVLPALLVAALPAWGDVLFSAHLGPREVRPGDDVYLTIEARGEPFDKVAFQADFNLINLRRVSGPLRDAGISADLGDTQRHHRLTWKLRAEGYGTAAVRDLQVRLDGRQLNLATEIVRVVSEPRPDPRQGAIRPPSRPGGSFLDRILRPQRPAKRPQVRLVAEAHPPQPWAGQQVTYELWLETQAVVQEQGLEQRPEFRGFWVEEPDARPAPATHQVARDGELFQRRRIAQFGVFPLRPGRYEIQPSKLSALAWVAGIDPDRVLLTSGQPRLDARPLPPVPEDLADHWSGLVGRYDLSARLLPNELTVGEAATLELTLTGEGHAGGMETPIPELPPNLSVLPAEEAFESGMRQGRVRSLRRWRLPVVPDREGTWQIPPVEIAYFDPQAGEYRLATAEPLILRARDAEVSGATGAATGSLLHPLRNAALPRRGAGPTRWRASLPWLFAMPWALLLAVGLRRALGRQDLGAATDPGAYARFAHHLERIGDEDRPRRAALAVEAAWRDLLATVYGVADSEPMAAWPARLREVGVAERWTVDLDHLLEDIAYLRHAPQLSTVDELTRDLHRRSLRLAHRLAP